MVHRIRLAMGYHGNEVGRYQALASGETPASYSNILNPPFMRLANIRYLYTNADVGAQHRPAEGTRSRAELGRFDRLPLSHAGRQSACVDNPGDGEGRRPGHGGDPARPAIRSAARRRDRLLRARRGRRRSPRFPSRLAITSRVTRYDPGHIAVELSAPAPAGSALVVSENYFPGWTASVDGHAPAPAVRTDYTFLGVPLPAGATKVLLRLPGSRLREREGW